MKTLLLPLRGRKSDTIAVIKKNKVKKQRNYRKMR